MMTDVGNYNLSLYYSVRLYTNILSVMLCILISFLIFSESIKLEVLLIVLSLKSIDGLSEIFHIECYKNSKFRISFIMKFSKSLCFFIFILISYYFEWSYVVFFILYFSCYLFFSLFEFIWLTKIDGFESFIVLKAWLENKCLIKDSLTLYLRYWYLGVGLIFNSLIIYTPNFFVEHYLNVDSVGVLGILTYFFVLGAVVINGVASALTPKLVNSFNNGSHDNFKQNVLFSVLFGAFIGMVGIAFVFCFGEKMLTILYSDAISRENNVLVILMIGCMFRYAAVFYGTGLTVMKSFKIQIYVSLCLVICMIISSYKLIPEFGLTGAAYSFVIIGFLELTFNYCLFNQVLKRKMIIE
jgi:O-antigen/teichoic acid export membrane protein